MRQPPCPICQIAAYPTPDARMQAHVDALRADIRRTEASIAQYEAAIAIWTAAKEGEDG